VSIDLTTLPHKQKSDVATKLMKRGEKNIETISHAGNGVSTQSDERRNGRMCVGDETWCLHHTFMGSTPEPSHLSCGVLAASKEKRLPWHGVVSGPAGASTLLVHGGPAANRGEPPTASARSLPRTCLHVPHHRLRILSGLKSGKLEKYIWSEALTSLKNRSSIHQSKLEKMSMPLAARSPMARLPRCLTQLSVASSTSVPCTQPASAQARRDILPSVLFEEG